MISSSEAQVRDRRAGERQTGKKKETIRRGRDGDRAGWVSGGEALARRKTGSAEARQTAWFVDSMICRSQM